MGKLSGIGWYAALCQDALGVPQVAETCNLTVLCHLSSAAPLALCYPKRVLSSGGDMKPTRTASSPRHFREEKC